MHGKLGLINQLINNNNNNNIPLSYYYKFGKFFDLSKKYSFDTKG